MNEPWQEVGDRIFVRRHEFFDMNVTLVIGGDRALVVDTCTTHVQARDLLAAVRELTHLDLLVVNTHAHFDHFFGNSVFRPAPLWSHRRCVEVITEFGEAQRAAAIEFASKDGQSDLAAELAQVEIVPPDHTFTDEHLLDVGGRAVRLRYLGRGHTDSDITLEVPDAEVLIAGDLVEEGGPPQFGDAFPLDWPITVERMLTHVTGRVVPGHGAVVDASFVRRQLADLEAMAALARRAHTAGADLDEVLADAPFSAQVSRHALQRAFAQLSGELVGES